MSLYFESSLEAYIPIWEVACVRLGEWKAPTTGLICSTEEVVCGGVVCSFAWMAFISVSTSVPKLTSCAWVDVGVVLTSVEWNTGVVAGACHMDSVLIGGLWLWCSSI